ncbi:MAG: hypothetical protein A3G76_01830 [Acidobacteria bacterium RIFCSPLOWO2_12_FULL_65_11]|nr:MAG: hypothetical protein A3H95_03735 [Acidobacteria bacterium RIFCSPLOWO2_02_FULL_64_15]OFW30458.1 MAG: hypothetical protein A3G76_01830 [Acidobacteria bacterium RIFCSPLOWO2_12_FULL_65_11]
MKKRLIIWLPNMLLLLTACGGGQGGQPRTSIDVNMTDYAYNPKEHVVPTGKDITVNIVNNGAVTHNFIIMKAGTNIGEDFDEADEPNVYWQVQLSPGKSVTTSFTAPSQRGEYVIVCSTPGHYLARMTGRLVVVAP